MCLPPICISLAASLSFTFGWFSFALREVREWEVGQAYFLASTLTPLARENVLVRFRLIFVPVGILSRIRIKPRPKF